MELFIINIPVSKSEMTIMVLSLINIHKGNLCYLVMIWSQRVPDSPITKVIGHVLEPSQNIIFHFIWAFVWQPIRYSTTPCPQKRMSMCFHTGNEAFMWMSSPTMHVTHLKACQHNDDNYGKPWFPQHWWMLWFTNFAGKNEQGKQNHLYKQMEDTQRCINKGWITQRMGWIAEEMVISWNCSKLLFDAWNLLTPSTDSKRTFTSISSVHLMPCLRICNSHHPGKIPNWLSPHMNQSQ